MRAVSINVTADVIYVLSVQSVLIIIMIFRVIVLVRDTRVNNVIFIVSIQWYLILWESLI